MRRVRLGSRGVRWLVYAALSGAAACYSEPDAVGDPSEGSDGSTADGGSAPSTSPTADDGPDAGPGSNTQGATDDTTAGDPDTSPPDTDTSPGSGSSDDGTADDDSTGGPAACSSGPLAVSWMETASFATQPNPQGLDGALIDGDEFLDIAVASYDTDSVSIYLGDGAGGFTLGTQVFASGNASSVRLAAIADDTPDLFVSYYNDVTFQNHLQRWRGDGSGAFQFGMPLGPAQGFELGNLNGDDYLDVALVAASNPPMLSMRAGDVTESFGPVLEIGSYPGFPLVGDLDGDGDDDLVSVQGTSATVLVNNNGVFAAQPSVNLVLPIGAAALGDPDDDGDLDLVTGTLGGGNTVAQVFPGDGAGGFGAPTPHPISNYTAHAVAKDVDADGIDDLLLVAGSGALTFLHSNGDGTMAGEDVTAADGCLNARGLVAQDINDDCIPDPILICSGAEEEVRVFLSQP